MARKMQMQIRLLPIVLMQLLCSTSASLSRTDRSIVLEFAKVRNLDDIRFRGGGRSDDNSRTDMSGYLEDQDISDTVIPPSLLVTARTIRLQGKDLHDRGDFLGAANLFKQAADSLENETENFSSEEYATCRLHQALCHLKSQDFDACLEACSDVLRDHMDGKPLSSSPAVRARAYHRRAKAKLGLHDASGALQDARSAAFLGDSKAVAFYGRLMRESPALSREDSSLQNLFPSSLSEGVSDTGIFDSLMNKSSSSGSAVPGFPPASLFMPGNNSGGALESLASGGTGLAKSVLNSLAKRLDDESTQVSISDYLQGTSKTQLRQLASMAGLNDFIQDSHLYRILSICHKVTPKTIGRTVRNTKRAVFGVSLLRRCVKIMTKYRSLLVAFALLQWAKSACLRPMPLARKPASKRATKTALKAALKANR